MDRGEKKRNGPVYGAAAQHNKDELKMEEVIEESSAIAFSL